MTRTAAARALGFALATLVAAPAAVAAQELRGVAIDAAGNPLPGTVVALHRVGGGGGSSVASATTDERGRFSFAIEPGDSAVYFAAMRYQERMYIGPAVHPGFGNPGEYRLAADPAAEAGTVASALAGQAPGAAPMGQVARAPGGGGAGARAAPWVAALLTLALAAALVGAAPRYRRRRTRDAVLELARIENRLASVAGDEDRDALARRRDRIRERLAPRS